jgi:hypothetical protein
MRPVELLRRSAVTPPNTSLITEMKPSFACKEIIDLTKDECGDVLIEFDQVKVLVTFETLGLLYAMIYSLEAADDDEASHNKTRIERPG